MEKKVPDDTPSESADSNKNRFQSPATTPKFFLPQDNVVAAPSESREGKLPSLRDSSSCSKPARPLPPSVRVAPKQNRQSPDVQAKPGISKSMLDVQALPVTLKPVSDDQSKPVTLKPVSDVQAKPVTLKSVSDVLRPKLGQFDDAQLKQEQAKHFLSLRTLVEQGHTENTKPEKFWVIYDRIGNSYSALGETERAIHYYEKAIQVIGLLPVPSERLPHIHKHIGSAYHKLGRLTKAKQHMDNAIFMFQMMGDSTAEECAEALQSWSRDTNEQMEENVASQEFEKPLEALKADGESSSEERKEDVDLASPGSLPYSGVLDQATDEEEETADDSSSIDPSHPLFDHIVNAVKHGATSRKNNSSKVKMSNSSISGADSTERKGGSKTSMNNNTNLNMFNSKITGALSPNDSQYERKSSSKVSTDNNTNMNISNSTITIRSDPNTPVSDVSSLTVSRYNNTNLNIHGSEIEGDSNYHDTDLYENNGLTDQNRNNSYPGASSNVNVNTINNPRIQAGDSADISSDSSPNIATLGGETFPKNNRSRNVNINSFSSPNIEAGNNATIRTGSGPKITTSENSYSDLLSNWSVSGSANTNINTGSSPTIHAGNYADINTNDTPDISAGMAVSSSNDTPDISTDVAVSSSNDAIVGAAGVGSCELPVDPFDTRSERSSTVRTVSSDVSSDEDYLPEIAAVNRSNSRSRFQNPFRRFRRGSYNVTQC